MSEAEEYLKKKAWRVISEDNFPKKIKDVIPIQDAREAIRLARKEIQKIAKTMIKKNDEGEEGQNAYYAQGLHEGFENGLVILHDVIEKRFLPKPQSHKEVKKK